MIKIGAASALLAVTTATGLAATHFSVRSPQITPGGTVPSAQVLDRFGCHGDNVSPALAWRGAPEGTKSFAVVLFDSDARGGAGWWHWIVADIPASVDHLSLRAGDPGGTLPGGAMQGVNSFGFAGYGGPCPPVGDAPHHYHLRVYALNTATIPQTALQSPEAAQHAIETAAIGRAEVTGRYGRGTP